MAGTKVPAILYAANTYIFYITDTEVWIYEKGNSLLADGGVRFYGGSGHVFAFSL